MKKQILALSLVLFMSAFSAKLFAQNNSLILNGAYTVMNGGTSITPVYLVVNQSNTLGIVRNSGHIVSEGQYNYVKWNAAATVGTFVYPFGVGGNAADYIPFTFNKTNGTDSISVSTWTTNQQNMPHPGISNVAACNTMPGITDSVQFAIDRFWDIQSPLSVTADITFSYLGSENTTITPTGNFLAQHWNGTSWDAQVGPGDAGVTLGVGTVGPVMAQNTFSPWVISFAPIPIASFESSDTTICPNSCINFTDLSTGPPTTWNWTFPGSSTPTSTDQNPLNICYATPGTYTATLIVSNLNGSDTTTLDIIVSPLPTVTATAVSDTICSGNCTDITANGANTYNWMPGSLSGSTVNVCPTSTTIYTVTGTSLAGCSNTATVSVTVNTVPTVTAVALPPTVCLGACADLTGGGASTYTWMPGSLLGTTVNVCPTINTTYSVTGTSADGCTNTATVSITVNPIPTVNATAVNPLICNGTCTDLNASGASTYDWMPGSLTGTTVNVCPTTSTTYTVTGTSALGCTGTAVTTVQTSGPTAGVSAVSTTITLGTNTQLTATGGGDYLWSPTIGLSCTTCSNPIANPIVTTEYCVQVTDTNGCTDSICITINVESPCGEVFVPSAFSPNYNGENEVLKVYGACIKTMNFVIYDRWGEKVFESTDKTIGWDGKQNGQLKNTGVYVYYLNGELNDGTPIKMKGNITLVR